MDKNNCDDPMLRVIDIKIDELDKRIQIQFEMNDIALKLSTTQLEKRLENMNEFRAQIKDERMNYLPREEYRIQHERLVEDIRQLQISKAELEGKASQVSVSTAQVIGFTALALSLAAILLRVMGL